MSVSGSVEPVGGVGVGATNISGVALTWVEMLAQDLGGIWRRWWAHATLHRRSDRADRGIDVYRRRRPNSAEKHRLVNEVVGGIQSRTILMFTIGCVTFPHVKVSADEARRKFFFALIRRWTSVVHLRRAFWEGVVNSGRSVD